MTSLAALILLAAGFATGLVLVVAAFVPGRPRLADLLGDRTPAGLPRQLAFVSVPYADLALVGRPVESFVLQRVTLTLTGALWIPLLATVLALGDVAPPLALTGGGSLTAAVIGWLLPAAGLRAKANAARAEFRAALASYCRLVALGRLGDRGPVEALRYPALLGDGWAFRRIREALDEASMLGDMPWSGLQRLADATGVRELRDLTHVITAAGQDGASIVDSLRAKAASIEQQLLADRATGASIRTDRMDVPLALLGLAFIAFLAFPGISTMLAS
jgi:hypothetical protein